MGRGRRGYVFFARHESLAEWSLTVRLLLLKQVGIAKLTQKRRDIGTRRVFVDRVFCQQCPDQHIFRGIRTKLPPQERARIVQANHAVALHTGLAHRHDHMLTAHFVHDETVFNLHSFRYAKLGTRRLDFGRIYENMVAIELMRRGWEVYVGVLYQKEVDFVAAKQGQRLYIQVSDDISQESTFEREVTPLRKIRDAYPKAIIAKTGHETTDWDGIKVIDLGRWLMGQTGEFDA